MQTTETPMQHRLRKTTSVENSDKTASPSPAPRCLPHRMWTPETMTNSTPIIVTTGAKKLMAAMASVPRNWPVNTLSTKALIVPTRIPAICTGSSLKNARLTKTEISFLLFISFSPSSNQRQTALHQCYEDLIPSLS